MTARIACTSGTEAQWTAANPVLLAGEVGFVAGTTPAKFKVGDGTKTWSQLGWGQPATLAQLAADATHRLVTDAEKAKWNKGYTGDDQYIRISETNVVSLDYDALRNELQVIRCVVPGME